MSRNYSPYTPLSAREERALDAAEAEHEEALEAARDALTATPEAALPVVLAAFGLDPWPEGEPTPSEWPVLEAVRSEEHTVE
ncbi:MAG TPA: hypothetical protein DCM32_00260, partial [Xanthomonadaceae bacterium]|nr:hypothetical protein [Xanthomonadaceae bacterium]